MLSKEQFDSACNKADAAMKEANGHVFEHMLKTRCIWCGRSPNVKGKCSGWFNSFLWHLSGELTGTYGAPHKPKEEGA
jgi:hypothetical protein